MSLYQTIVDESLNTDSKEIVGAINEVNEKAENEWRFINRVDVTEDTMLICITEDSNGQPFELTDIYIIMLLNANTSATNVGTLRIFNSKTYDTTADNLWQVNNSAPASGYRWYQGRLQLIDGMWILSNVLTSANTSYQTNTSGYEGVDAELLGRSNVGTPLTGLCLAVFTESGIGAGSFVKLYGR